MVNEYTPYGSKGRYSDKFRVMQQQQQGLSCLLVASLSFSFRCYLALASSCFLLPPLRGEILSSSSFLSVFNDRSSGLLVSFRFSSLGISLWCARGDLGARPPTRELVNYFAQRDTSFLALLHLSHSLSSLSFSSSCRPHFPFPEARRDALHPVHSRQCAISDTRRRFSSGDKVPMYIERRANAHVRSHARANAWVSLRESLI